VLVHWMRLVSLQGAAVGGMFRRCAVAVLQRPCVPSHVQWVLLLADATPQNPCRHETAVVAALLHDVLDDTSTTPEALCAAFGPTVTAMVVSVSKLSAVNQMLRRDKRKVIGLLLLTAASSLLALCIICLLC
jgi:(p)ppGpp synthase/HD superfamily hydrolase